MKTSKILLPTQWEGLRENLNPYYQTVCDALIHTGLRSDSEFWRFVESPQWYTPDGEIVMPSIPGIQKSRTIRLSLEGKKAVKALINLIHSGSIHGVRGNIRDALRRAATGDGKVIRVVEGKPRKVPRKPILDSNGINPEMLRKTLVAWLIACYPEKKYEILISLGINGKTMIRDYTGIVCPKSELIKARKHLKGW